MSKAKLQTRKQEVSDPTNWLTYLEPDKEDNVQNRQFAKKISLPDTAPDWTEWTEQQYNDWQEEHKEPEPDNVTDIEPEYQPIKNL